MVGGLIRGHLSKRAMPRTPADETKVAAARSRSVSMRTTIPAHITKQMGMEVGDTLVWELDKVKGRWSATISKK